MPGRKKPAATPTSEDHGRQQPPVMRKAVANVSKPRHRYTDMCREVFSAFRDEDFYSDRAQHVYFYSQVDQESVEILRNAIYTAARTKQAQPGQNTGVRTSVKPIVIHIHSPGGDAYLGISMINWLRSISVPIAVIVDGYACSAATPLLVSAPYRVMHDQAFVLIHEVAETFLSGTTVKYHESKFDAHVSDSIMETMRNIYRKATKLTEEDLEELLNRDKFIASDTCKAKQIVDRVIKIDKQASINRWAAYKNTDMVARQASVANTGEPMTWNSRFNHVYQYSQNKDETKTELLRLIGPLDKLLQATTSNTPRPLVLHANMYTFPARSSYYDISSVMIRVALSPIPINSVIDSDIDILHALPCIMAHKRYMYKNANIQCHLVYEHHHKARSYYFHDINDNARLLQKNVIALLKQYTTLPQPVLDSMFLKRFVIKHDMALQYRLVDAIIDPYE